MIIKTFVGESSAAALKKVRTELGGDAVVLATRSVANEFGGYDTEVTACLDRAVPTASTNATSPVIGNRRITKPVWNRMATSAASKGTTPVRTTQATSSTPNATVDSSTELLRDLDIPKTTIGDILEAVKASGSVQNALSNQVATRIAAFPHFNSGDRVLVLGPVGSGKTSVVAKLAAQLIGSGQTVTLTGYQQQKIGAVDELQSITELVGTGYTDTLTVTEHSDAVTLIDCGSLAVTRDDIATLNLSHTLFIFPATMRGADLSEAIAQMNGLAVTGVCMTMLDTTHRLGSLFVVCDKLNAPLLMVSLSAFGVESLVAPKADSLALQMLGRGDKNA
jgi:flagellar biosynthesis protein FlhF